MRRTIVAVKANESQNYKWVFTHNSSENEDIKEIFELYKSQFRQDENIKDTTMQMEVGHETGRPHIQGRIHFVNKKTKGGVLNMFRQLVGDVKQITVGPEIDAQASITYCSKDDTRLPGTEPFHKLKKMPVYTGADIACLDYALRPWQKQVLDLINEKPYHTRHIYYLYDKKGASGKSAFLKWLFFRRIVSVAQISHCGTAAQLSSSAYNLGPRDVYFVDLPRARTDTLLEIARVVEAIKGGTLQSVQYGGSDTVLFNPPLVIMFANYLPDVDWFSYDRWKIFDVNPDTYEMTPLSVSRVRELEKASKAKKRKN